jgi:tight adherence protein B
LNWALVIIALAASALFFREVNSIRKSQRERIREESWPQFEEAYISAIQSGISISDSFSFVADFESPGLRNEVTELISNIDRGESLEQALRKFRAKVALASADLFVAIISLANHSGGNSLVSALTQHVQAVRFELAARGDVRARQGAILSVAKLGLLSPWVLVAVLSVNPQTRETFNSVAGQALLLGGFAVSFVAYRLVVAAGKLAKFKHIFEISYV